MRNVRAGGAGLKWLLKWISALALAIVVAPSLLSAQDVTLTNTTTANGREIQARQYMSATLGMRAGTAQGDEVILRVDQKKIYFIHPRQKTYSEMTFDDVQKMAAAATTAKNDLPPEAAAQMKKMMGGGTGGGEVTVTHVPGAGETIAGYATEKYHVTMGSIMEGDLWAAPALAMPPVFYDAMRAVTPSNPVFDMKKIYAEYRKIKGTPLKSITIMKMMGQSMTSTTVVTTVDRSPIPAETFAVPAGYKLVPIGK